MEIKSNVSSAHYYSRQIQSMANKLLDPPVEVSASQMNAPEDAMLNAVLKLGGIFVSVGETLAADAMRIGEIADRMEEQDRLRM